MLERRLSRCYTMMLGLSIAFALGGCRSGANFDALPGAASFQTPSLFAAPLQYQVLYRFQGASDHGNPAVPDATLLAFQNALYGTSNRGGVKCKGYGTGCGTIFSYTPAGVNVRYEFQGLTDGTFPVGPLLAVKGVLYGTTVRGGGQGSCNGNCGSLFSFVPGSGKIVFYPFGGGSDGANPSGNLAVLGNKIYGTTQSGGAKCKNLLSCGTIYSFDPSTSTRRTVYRFGGDDGALPVSGLTALGSTLVGTTEFGGTSGSAVGNGLVYSYIPGATRLRKIYAFKGMPDGANPLAPLTIRRGIGFGTSSKGGIHNYGTVFKVALTTGKESKLHDFAGGKAGDGAYPFSPVALLNGSIYGTTATGGTGACSDYAIPGCGTVFRLSNGHASILHNFHGSSDGASPKAGLTIVNGWLYGATADTTNPASPPYIAGTIFRLKP